MLSIILLIPVIVIGYLIGNIQSAYIYGKYINTDFRELGSGNLGATNALRTKGKKAGAVVFAGDFLKCYLSLYILSVFMHRFLLGSVIRSYAHYMVFLMMMALSIMLGHCYPYKLGFNGGKGVACFAGFLFFISPVYAIVLLLIFSGIVYYTKYVSLGSITVASLYLIFTFMNFLLHRIHYIFHINIIIFLLYLLLPFAICGLILLRHIENIRRLLLGTEKKIEFK